jgi:Cu(I)/Ag(I) efflux system membrane fusion protein/cobalt-zinc-cadmium efflux system membrane fusion protein
MKILVFCLSVAVLVLAAILVWKVKSPASPPVNSLTTNAPQPKQLWTCLMDPQIVQDHPGLCPICKMPLTPLNRNAPQGELLKPIGANEQRQVLYYWDPMLGPSSISSKPGKSAMGMDLVPVYKDEVSGGAAVQIDPAIVQNMGVRTALVTRGSLQKTVRTVGMLSIPESAQFDVNLRINGWIEKLYADQEGMHLHKGEALFDIYSPELQVAEQELIVAAAAANSPDTKSLDAGKGESQNLLDSARRKLSLLGVADEDIDAISKSATPPPTVPFRSPADGEVEEKMVSQGSAVQPGMKILRIEDHSKLWLTAQVYEQQVSIVKVGQQMEASFESLPGSHTGTIDFIYPHLDPTTRTVMVRATLDAPDGRLKPGMYAMVNIITKPLADALIVPREAVIDTGTRQIVFVVQSEGHFDPRIVHMGLSGDNDQVQILDGLKEGEAVVTSGQFLLDVTSRTQEALEKIKPDLQSK